MTDRITYNVGMAVAGGPTVSAPAASSYIDVEAWDKIEVEIEKSTGPTAIIVQPSEMAQLEGLLIISDFYDAGGDLSFTVDSEVNPIPLTGPLMLIGAGAIAVMLGAPTCNVLNFTNANTETDANITILAIRTALEPGA